MDGFRIVCDLSQIIGGIRKKSFLYVDIENLFTIHDLCLRIKALFNIKKNILLMIDDVYLPFLEDIKILRADDVVKVTPFDSAIRDTNLNDGVSQHSEEITGNVIGSCNDVLLDTQLSALPQRKKRKRRMNVSENSNPNETPGLTAIIPENAEIVGLEIQHTKRNKRKRRYKNLDSKTEANNVIQGQSDIITEIVTDLVEQTPVEVPTGEHTAVIPTGDPEPGSLARKRKRIRIRKRKANNSDVPPEAYAHQNFSSEPARNKYTKSLVNPTDLNSSHVRFSSNMSNVESESLDYDPIEDDLLIQHQAVQVDSKVEKNGSEINGIKSCTPTVLASGNGTPLVVRRTRIDSVQPVQPAKVRKFLQSPPEINDIITFKVWKMDQSYCPQISGLIKAKVLNFCKDSQQVRFFILDGKSNCEQPNGKFSLDVTFAEDGPLVPPTIPDIMELHWQEMLEVEIFL